MILFNPFRVDTYCYCIPGFIRGYSNFSPSGYYTILPGFYYKLFQNSYQTMKYYYLHKALHLLQTGFAKWPKHPV